MLFPLVVDENFKWTVRLSVLMLQQNVNPITSFGISVNLLNDCIILFSILKTQYEYDWSVKSNFHQSFLW